MSRKAEDIVRDGIKTRFKKGNTIQKDFNGKPWSIRNQLMWLMAQPLDYEDLDRELTRLRNPKKKGQRTGARVAAVRILERMLKKVEPQMVQVVIENAEGKLPQEIQQNPFRDAPTYLPTQEEAEAAYKEFINK